MIDTPTRRVVLGAGVFAAGSLLMVNGSVAQAPLAPTPACHDGDDATVLTISAPNGGAEMVHELAAALAGG